MTTTPSERAGLVGLVGRELCFARQGREILRGVDVELYPGDLVALTGPSGAGKSTLLMLLAGLEAPTSGSVRLDGRGLAGHGAAARRRIGVVFQGYALVALLTAAENVELALVAAGVPVAQAVGRAHEALDSVGLAARAEHLVEELSGGQQQRVAIARALAGRPDVLLVDEPSAEQDDVHRQAILEALADASAGGTAVLIATHDVDVARRCRSRLHLVDGRLSSLEALA